MGQLQVEEHWQVRHTFVYIVLGQAQDNYVLCQVQVQCATFINIALWSPHLSIHLAQVQVQAH